MDPLKWLQESCRWRRLSNYKISNLHPRFGWRLFPYYDSIFTTAEDAPNLTCPFSARVLFRLQSRRQCGLFAGGIPLLMMNRKRDLRRRIWLVPPLRPVARPIGSHRLINGYWSVIDTTMLNLCLEKIRQLRMYRNNAKPYFIIHRGRKWQHH